MNNTNIDQTLTDLSRVLKDLVAAAHQPVAQEITQFLEFRARKGEENFGKGIIWSGKGYTKQLVFNGNPDINQYLIYNGATDRLGLGTEAPNAAFSVAENAIEVMLGTNDDFHGIVGTFASTDFDIVTDNTSRISVKANGNIDLGNAKRNPIQVKVNGKLSVGVENPDPAVDLHVAGAVRFSGHIQMYASNSPQEGTYAVGDIVWNTAARVGTGVGWVCLRAGSPGAWYPFGEIKERG